MAELRIVQETVRKIEGDEDSDGDCPGGEFSDTEDETSTNARYVPGCRAEKVRVRNRVRRRQQSDRVPSNAWLQPEEEIPHIRDDSSRVVLPLLMRQGMPKRRRNRVQKTDRYRQSVNQRHVEFHRVNPLVPHQSMADV